MISIPIANAGQHGIITDLPFTELPLNAWTAGRNVRFYDNVVQRVTGQKEVFPTPLVMPKWLQQVPTTTLRLWLYAGDTGVGATDGTSHANITRASGPYTSNIEIGWTGTVIEDIPVINNGLDVPQMWNKPSLSQLLQDLSNWPANTTARVIRGFKRYLIALDVTKDGIRHPNMIKWSHQAPTGEVPASWDEKDETNDAGEWVLPGEGGFLIDTFPLRDNMILYKESQIWLFSYVGTAAGVFIPTRKFAQAGCFTRRCVAEFMSGRHFVFTGDDAVVHDGQNIDSVMSDKVKNLIKGKIDAEHGNKAFVAINYPLSEVWTCVPQKGQTYPDLALIWNWRTGLWGVRDLPNVAFIENGQVPPPSEGEVWDQAEGVWDTDNALWGERAPAPAESQMVLAVPGQTKLMVAGQGVDFNGAEFESYIERVGLGFPVKANGPPDYTRMKQVIGLWPHIEGTQGGVINVHLGYQHKIGGPVTYGPVRAFTIGESEMLDFSDSEASRLIAIKFHSSQSIQWKLSSYDVDYIDRGVYA